MKKERQLTISGTGVAVPPGLYLTPRQRLVLDLIAERPRSSEEIGAHVHASRGAHRASARCEWCRSEGAALGSRLREHGLVRFARKLGVWYLVETGLPRRQGAPDDDIPF
jgi:hypothetical protein